AVAVESHAGVVARASAAEVSAAWQAGVHPIGLFTADSGDIGKCHLRVWGGLRGGARSGHGGVGFADPVFCLSSIHGGRLSDFSGDGVRCAGWEIGAVHSAHDGFWGTARQPGGFWELWDRSAVSGAPAFSARDCGFAGGGLAIDLGDWGDLSELRCAAVGAL